MTTLIRTEEWFSAHHAVIAVDPDENNPDHGVAVVARNGQRHWYAWSDKVVVMTTGVDVGEAPDTVLPVQRRLLSFVLSQSYVRDVSLTVDGTHATVLSAGNCRHFDRPITRRRHSHRGTRRPSPRRGCPWRVFATTQRLPRATRRSRHTRRQRAVARHLDRADRTRRAHRPERSRRSRDSPERRCRDLRLRRPLGLRTRDCPTPRRPPTPWGCSDANAGHQQRGASAHRTLACIDRHLWATDSTNSQSPRSTSTSTS